MGIASILAKGLAKKGIKKDFAKKAVKMAPAKPGSTKGIISTGKPGKLGKLKDKLAKAKVELKQHKKSESASWHKHLEKQVEVLSKRVEKQSIAATPDMKNTPMLLKKQQDISGKSAAKDNAGKTPAFLRKQVK